MIDQKGDNAAQVVFIDANVPDIQDLLDGLAPDTQAFVLDPGSDGLDQIAAILSANDLTALSSISIVGHGASGELQLGSATITDVNLAGDSAALAQIGAALRPSGTLQLYGCDVGSGAAGQQFIADLSQFAGGATVEAATHLVGDAADGGSWTLDASTGPVPADTSVPFTPAALTGFQGLLPAAPTGQLFFRINQGNDVQLGDIDNNGSGLHSIYFGGGNTSGTPQNIGTFNGNETSIAVDTAAGLVFSVGIGRSTDNTPPIQNSYDAFSVHNLSTGALISTTEFGANTGDVNNDDVVQALALNPFTNTLYVGDWGVSAATTGVREFTYNPASGALTPVATNGGFLFTASQVPSYVNANAFFLDTTHNLLYYVNDDTGYDFSPFSSVNGVYVVSTTGPTFTATELTSNGSGTGQFPVADQSGAGTQIGAHGNIVGLAVDVADGIVFFESTDNLGSSNIGLWWVSASGGAGQTAHAVTLPPGVTLAFAGQTNEGGDAAGLTFDQQTGQLYLTNANNSASTPNLGAIYDLQWNNGTKSVTLVATYDTATLVGTTSANVEPTDAPSTTTFDDLPVLSTSATSTHATEQGAAVTLLASTPTITDTDGDHLASATVQITAGTFSSNETSANDDHLGFAAGNVTGNQINGTNITFSYSSATETLTLTGYDTLTDYQTALSEIQYNTTGNNPTNYGNDTARTITWHIDDGAVGDPTGANTTTTTLNIDAVNDAPVNNLPGTVSATEDTAKAITGLSVSDVDADPANQNIQVTLSVSQGTLTILTNVANGITSSAITAGANGSSTITLTATQNQINATLANASGLTYTPSANFNNGFGSESLQIATDDLGHTGTGGSLTTTSNLTINVAAVDDPPNLQPNSPTAVGYLENATATALFAGEAINFPISDPDQSANFAGGSLTVGITGGAVTGDEIVLTGSIFHISGSNLEDSGDDIIGTISGNGTQTVTISALTADATPSAVNDLLTSFGFLSTSNDPGAGDRTITETFNDGGNTGAVVGSTSASVTQTEHVTPVNDPPTLTASSTNPTYTENAPAVGLFSGASTSTVEAGQTITTLVLTVSNVSDGANEILHIDGSDVALTDGNSVMTAGNGLSASVVLSSGTATVTLTKGGGVSAATVSTVVDGITYRDAGDNPTAGTRAVTLTSIQDNGGIANSGSDTTVLSIASTATVVAVNDAPTVTAGGTQSYTEQTPAVVVDNGVTVNDPDSPDLVGATATISPGSFQPGDTLHFADTATITGSYDTATGVLTLSGSDTVAAYQAALRSVTFDNQSNHNPTAAGTDLSRTVTWQVDDGSGANNFSNQPTSTINIAAITVAYFEANQATLDQIPSGFGVTDTAANIGSFAGLAALTGDISHITEINTTDAQVVIGWGRFSPYQAALDKITGGFTFDGQAPAIEAHIDAIAADAAHINSITAENGTVTVPVGTFLNDEAGLNEIVGGFEVTDTAANIFNGLNSLQGDTGHITSITATDTRVQVGAGKFVPDETILNKIAGGFDLLGLSPAIGAHFDAFEADISHIGTVSFADASTPVLNLTQTQAANDAGLLAKITSSYVENVSNAGATTTTGHGDGLTINAVAGGNDTITGGGASESFVFGANFGIDTIVDFSTHLASPGNDTITLPAAEFTDFTTMFNNDTTFSGGNAIIQSGGDQLTIDNINSSTLQAAQALFHFA